MSVPISMYFPKNTYLENLFNRLILLFHQSGLMSYWTSANEENKYLYIESYSRQPKKLTVEHLSGIFKIWISASFASFVVFLIEFFWHRKLVQKIKFLKKRTLVQ